MSERTHDTLVYRLSQMLIKLNQGEKLIPNELADEFGVSIRTIQRDLNVRFSYLPLERVSGAYVLSKSFLGQFNMEDIKSFAELAGISGLFPSLTRSTLQSIFDYRLNSAFLVKGHSYEDLSGKEQYFELLEKAIINNNEISFLYNSSGVNKSYSCVQPYKLINNKGIWYLAVKESGKLKTFVFTKIQGMKLLQNKFEPDLEIMKHISEDKGVWIKTKSIEIVLRIDSQVASYFKRRELIANQVIDKELEDGSLILSTKVGHINQVLPIVKYWIPNIQIISPEYMKTQLQMELSNYLEIN